MQPQTETKTVPFDSRDIPPRSHTYRVGNINFIVTPVYPSQRGETMSAIMLKLMNTEIET
jgi:hypothetical protein